MRTIHILISVTTLLTTLSCVKGTSDLGEQTDGNMLRVKFDAPELVVKSGEGTPIFYAYIPSELEAGYIHPIGYSDINSEGYYLYNLPEGTTDVIFTNISNDNEEICLKTDEDGNVMFELIGEHPMLESELLYGTVSEVNTSSSFNVGIERLNTRVSHYFYLVDSEGNSLPTDEISSVNVIYHCLGNALTITEDGTYLASSIDKESGYGITSAVGDNDNHLYSANVIPTNDYPTIMISVNFTNGSLKEYVKTLDKILEANHHYSVNLRLRKLNGEATFTLDDPDVTTNEQYPSFSNQEFFILSDGTTVGSSANDQLTINVDTALPYEWTYEVTEGEEFFNIKQIDEQLIITALSDNENEIRSATIVLKTSEGYTKTIKINQKNSLKHSIVMTSQHDYSHTEIYVSGENITVQDPNDAEPRLFEGNSNNRAIYIDGLTKGSNVNIEGDVITHFRATGTQNDNHTDEFGNRYDYYSDERGYYYNSYSNHHHSFTFSNCIYLEDIAIKGDDSIIDVSEMPSLRRIYTQGNKTLTSIVFAEGQKVEHLSIIDCDQISAIDITKIASTLKSVNLYNCDNLAGIIMTDCQQLKYMNANYCYNLSLINLTGCSGLENLSIWGSSFTNLNLTNCTALRSLGLYKLTLNKLVSTGMSSLETILTNNTKITNLDLSGNQTINHIGDLTTEDINVSGCSSLTSLGKLYSVKTVNISNCPVLRDAYIEYLSDETQVFNYSETPLESIEIRHLNSDTDFSGLTSLKKLHLIYCQSTISAIDLASNTALEDLYIHFSSNNSTTVQSLYLPSSLKKLNLNNLTYYPGPLNLSGFTSLEELDLYNINRNLKEINLSGCTSLKSINRDDADNEIDNHSYHYCSSVMSVNMTDCTALEYFNMDNANISSLDFSWSPRISTVDARNNEMDATAIDNMISTLPDRSNEINIGQYYIAGNPGADTHNESVANDKGWWLKN